MFYCMLYFTCDRSFSTDSFRYLLKTRLVSAAYTSTFSAQRYYTSCAVSIYDLLNHLLTMYTSCIPILLGMTVENNGSVRVDDRQSQWEMLNFDPENTHEPLKRLSPNLACDDYVMDTFDQEKFGLNPLRGFFSPIYAKCTLPCSLRYTTHVYYFF